MMTFKELLAKSRRNSNNATRGGHLTQSELANLISAETGINCTPQVISQWEKGKRTPSVADRPRLLAAIKIFVDAGGIHSLEEANALLTTLDFRGLDKQEIEGISADWLDATPPSILETNNLSSEIGIPNDDNSKTRERIKQATEWLDAFTGWSSADEHMGSTWEGRIVHVFTTVTGRITWHAIVQFICLIIAVSLAFSWIASAFQLNNLTDDTARLNASIRLFIATVIIPILIAFITPLSDKAQFTPTTKLEQRHVFVMKLAGSASGFILLLPFIFAVAIANETTQLTIATRIYQLLLLLALLFAYIVARRIPLRPSRSHENKPHPHPIDKLMIGTMFFLGGAIAFLLYIYYHFFVDPRTVIALLLMIIGLVYWELEGKKHLPLIRLGLITGGVITFVCMVTFITALVFSGDETQQLTSAESWKLFGILIQFACALTVILNAINLHDCVTSLSGVAIWAGTLYGPLIILSYLPLSQQQLQILTLIPFAIWFGFVRHRVRTRWWFPAAIPITFLSWFIAFGLLITDRTDPMIAAGAFLAICGALLYWVYQTSPSVHAQRQAQHE